MLGLLTHEPHFALLREEVTFGRTKKQSSTMTAESQTFYLMHLNLFREYLDLEFSSLKDTLPFKYDLERIIDDFILMSFFIGNDFLPHLPGLHINEGALALMFKIYKQLLPTLGGYLNENGDLILDRCQKMVEGLGDFEKEQFEEEMGDMSWLDTKQSRTANGNTKKVQTKPKPGSSKSLSLTRLFIIKA